MKRAIRFKNKASHKVFGDQKGIAIFEMLFLLLVFIVLFGLTLGFWGAIHTGTLQSISARHYSFEVLNNRSHFEYHRDWPVLQAPSLPDEMIGNGSYPRTGTKGAYHGNLGMRFFYVTGVYDAETSKVSTRGLNFFKEIDRHTATEIPPSGSIPGHDLASPGARGGKANPIWIKVGYGICMEWKCGE